jgi:hypothetical protein
MIERSADRCSQARLEGGFEVVTLISSLDHRLQAVILP